MCVPMLGMVAGLAGSMVSAMGAKSQADAEAAAAERAAVAAKIEAQQDRYVGQTKQERIGVDTDRKIGTQVAGFAAGGVDPGYGSAASVIFSTEEAGQTAQDDTYIEYRSRANRNEEKAKDLEFQAASKRKAGSIAAAGSFLGGLGGAFKSAGGGLKLNETA